MYIRGGDDVYTLTLTRIGTHFVTYIYYCCAHLSVSLPEAVHNLLRCFLCSFTVCFRVQKYYFLFKGPPFLSKTLTF